MDRSREQMAQHLLTQAEACRALGSALYAELLERAAADVRAGGIVARVLAGHEDDPGPSALGLRLLGTLHRLVLEGSAPRLARHFPSVGGTPGSELWAAALATVEERLDEVRAGLDGAPQTNEVGRAAALLGGLLHVAAWSPHPVVLLEIGASAGLNLRADRFRYEFDGGGWGDPDSPVALRDAWRGSLPPLDAPLRIVERRGADIAPVDPSTAAGRTTLLSYVWPDQQHRLARLRGAFRLVDEVPVELHRTRAAAFLSDVELRDGCTTVLWHSVMWQYLSATEQAAARREVDRLASAATVDAPFAHLVMEPRRAGPGHHPFLVVLHCRPGGTEQILGRAAPHGTPVTWGMLDGRRWRR